MAANTMRAFGYSRHGDASVQQLLTVPVPEIGAVPTGIRIKTHACAFNPIDYKRRGGAMKMVVPEKVWPVILGYDVAGTVESVGPAVTKFKPGDQVYARLGGAKEYPGRGTCAEYTLGTEELVSKKPKNMSFEEAAGVPLAALTALQMLRRAGLKQGDAVFVTAGAGGVGHYAIQIAKALGAARVVATASAAKHPLLKELGCDETVDYRTQNYTQLFADRPFDIGFDNVSEVPQLCKVVKPGGHVVSNTQGFSGRSFSDAGVANVNWVIRAALYLIRLPAERAAAAAKVTFSAIFLNANAKDLDFLTGLIEEGKLKSIVKVYEGIEKAGEAMAALEGGRATGKVVVKIV